MLFSRSLLLPLFLTWFLSEANGKKNVHHRRHHHHHPFAPYSSSSSSPSINVVTSLPRGGGTGGPLLDPESAVKAFLTVTAGQGLLMNMAPKFINEVYGITSSTSKDAGPASKVNTDPTTLQFLTNLAGTGIFSYALTLGYMVFQGKSLKCGTMAAYLVWMYHELRLTLSGERAKCTGNAVGGWITLSIFAAMIFSLTQDFFDTAIKVSSFFWILSGLQMIVSPTEAWESWNCDKTKLNKKKKSEILMLRCCGHHLVASGVVALSVLLKDATPLQAAGYGSVVWLAFHAANLLNGGFKEAGWPEGPFWVWLVGNAGIVALTLL